MKLKYKYTKFVFTGDNYADYEVISVKPKVFSVYLKSTLLGTVELVGGTSSKTKARVALERVLSTYCLNKNNEP